MSGDVFVSLVLGLESGLRFHWIPAAVTAAAAAAVTGYRRAPRSRDWWAAGILFAGWAIGEGLTAVQWVAGNPTMFKETPEAYWLLVTWIPVGLALGYVLPTFAGAYVGRLVHKGTGYLSAAVVALTIVPALATLGGLAAAALERAVA